MRRLEPCDRGVNSTLDDVKLLVDLLKLFENNGGGDRLNGRLGATRTGDELATGMNGALREVPSAPPARCAKPVMRPGFVGGSSVTDGEWSHGPTQEQRTPVFR